MARGRKKELQENPASCNWKALLYPDNEQHMQAAALIQSFELCESIWITHKNYDLDGHLITEGTGKPHMHFALRFQNQVRQGALCKKLGLIDSESGLPDIRFLRPVSGRLSQWLLYLTHITEPDKEQYSFFDLSGSASLLRMYEHEALERSSKDMSVRDCISAVMDWIDQQQGIISQKKFARWLVGTPFLRVRSDRLVLAYIQDHNDREYAVQRKDYISQVSSSYQILQSRASGGDDWQDYPPFDSDLYESITGD